MERDPNKQPVRDIDQNPYYPHTPREVDTSIGQSVATDHGLNKKTTRDSSFDYTKDKGSGERK